MPLFFPRVEAHTTAYNHLVCTNMTTPQQDMVQLDIRTHLKSGAIPTGANDGYIYNDPPEDPRGAVHPTEDPGTQVLYRVISQAPSAAYIASQKINGESDLTCNIDLTCKDTCDIPAESGRCDSGCNITLQTGSCPQYNKSASFDVYTGNTDTFIRWDDGSTNTMVTPQPSPQTKSHTFTNPGKYDVTVRCASQVCHKRFNVACQDGAANPTLTPLPTTTPAGGTSCMSPLRCSHPCSCDPSSTSYTNAHCDQLESTYDYSSGYGSSQGTTDGMACSPGLVCCKPAQATSKAWYKTKDVDFHELGGLANSIPSNATAFNATDAGDCNPDDGNALNCHIIGKGGLVSANGGINLGMSVSNKNIWRLGSSTYRKDTQMTPDSYIQYLRSRKETVNIDDPEDVQNDKVNYLSGDQTIYVIDDNGMQGKHLLYYY